jgi:hypothetical protein
MEATAMSSEEKIDFSLAREIVKNMRKRLRSASADLQEILDDAEQGGGVDPVMVERVALSLRRLMGDVSGLKCEIPEDDDVSPEPVQ